MNETVEMLDCLAFGVGNGSGNGTQMKCSPSLMQKGRETRCSVWPQHALQSVRNNWLGDLFA